MHTSFQRSPEGSEGRPWDEKGFWVELRVAHRAPAWRLDIDARHGQGPRPQGSQAQQMVFVLLCSAEAPRVLGVMHLHMCPKEAPLATVWGISSCHRSIGQETQIRNALRGNKWVDLRHYCGDRINSTWQLGRLSSEELGSELSASGVNNVHATFQQR